MVLYSRFVGQERRRDVRAGDRRQFLSMLSLAPLAAIGVSGTVVEMVRPQGLPPTRRLMPRFRRRKGANVYSSGLAPGFYLNPKSNVVHYVLADRTIRCVHKISEGALRSLPTITSVSHTVAFAKGALSRGCWSITLERVALDAVARKDIDGALALLSAELFTRVAVQERLGSMVRAAIEAVPILPRRDSPAGRKTGDIRRGFRIGGREVSATTEEASRAIAEAQLSPLLRICDLYATLCATFARERRLKELVALFERHGQFSGIPAIDRRVVSWKNGDSKWRKLRSTGSLRWKLPVSATVRPRK